MKRKKIYVSETPLVKQWDFSKNKESPGEVSANCHNKFWWVCGNGHSWRAVVKNRYRNNVGCPVCCGRCAGRENNLAVVKPDVLGCWDKIKNIGVSPYDFTPFSNKKVWWVCKKGHSWEAPINDVSRGSGCPYCAGKKVCEDNCLATLRPDIVNEWHPTKNGELTAESVTKSSHKLVWWICSNGHEWGAQISSRVCGHGCPYCSGQKACDDNCLAALRPDLAKEWHPTKNTNLTPRDVTCGDSKKVWWLCDKGHSWFVSVYNRSRGNNCPYCSGRMVCEDNCLSTLRPDLSREWHLVKNGELTPGDITVSSNKKVWWCCKVCGFDWLSVVNNRTKKGGTGCPQCSNGPVSKISQKWLDLLNIPQENREILLPDLKIRVDAFVPETNTVYEFLGDYWHGNPAIFLPRAKNKVIDKTFGQLYDETKARIFRLKGAGYKVVYVWENDFKHTRLKGKNGKNSHQKYKESL